MKKFLKNSFCSIRKVKYRTVEDGKRKMRCTCWLKTHSPWPTKISIHIRKTCRKNLRSRHRFQQFSIFISFSFNFLSIFQQLQKGLCILRQARQGDIHVQSEWVHCTLHNLFAFLFSLIWDSSSSSTPSRYSWLTRRGRIAWNIEANYIQFTCDSNGEWKKCTEKYDIRGLDCFYLFIGHSSLLSRVLTQSKE